MECGILPLVVVVESLQLVLDLLGGVQLWVWSVVDVQYLLKRSSLNSYRKTMEEENNPTEQDMQRPLSAAAEQTTRAVK